MWQLEGLCPITVLEFLGRLLGWLRGGAAAASSYALHVLQQLPVLATGGRQLTNRVMAELAALATAGLQLATRAAAELAALATVGLQLATRAAAELAALATVGLQLSCGAALVLVFVYLVWRRPEAAWGERLEAAWDRLLAAAWAYVMRERRGLALWKAFVRNRKRLKYTILALRLVQLIRLTYVFMEDVFFTGYWFFLVLDDYVRDLVADFHDYYDDYCIENDNLAFTTWYCFYIFREQSLYHQVARRALRPSRTARRRGQHRWLGRWGSRLHRRRRAYLGYHSGGAIQLDAHREAARPRR